MPGGWARHTPALVSITAAAATMVFCIVRLLQTRNYPKSGGFKLYPLPARCSSRLPDRALRAPEFLSDPAEPHASPHAEVAAQRPPWVLKSRGAIAFEYQVSRPREQIPCRRRHSQPPATHQNPGNHRDEREV